jgi:DNA-binding MarR family transcriptional regulator
MAHPLDEDALGAVRALHSAVEDLLDAAATTYGINRTDLRCLELLDRQGPMSAGQLSAEVGISPAAVTKLLQRLQRSGFLTVEKPASDHRQQIARTSDRHRALRTAVWGPVRQGADAVFATLSESDRHQLTRTLQSLAEVARNQAAQLAMTRTDE